MFGLSAITSWNGSYNPMPSSPTQLFFLYVCRCVCMCVCVYVRAHARVSQKTVSDPTEPELQEILTT